MSKITIVKSNNIETARNNRRFFSGRSGRLTNYANNGSFLYKFVYTSRFSIILVCFLLVSFMFQGVQISFAAELSDVASDSTDKTLLETVLPDIEQVDTDEEEYVSVVQELEGVHDFSDNLSLPSDNVISDSDETVLSTDPGEIELNDTSMSEASDIEDGVNIEQNIEEVNPEIISANDYIELDSTTATGSEMVINDQENIGEEDSEGVPEESDVSVVYIDRMDSPHQHVFDKPQCVSVGNDTYHCTKSSQISDDSFDQVYSAKGSKGNLEIFIIIDKQIKQVTDNDFDDKSPKHDAKSGRIVWQRLVEGRWHIMVYDLEKKIEMQLTSGNRNNMEPAISGSYIVWQQWDGDDWEILFFDGLKTGQITDNFTQDIGPVVEDRYIVWTAIGEREQTVKVYSIETGDIQSIGQHEGGVVVNPRFVLVYDTKMENGDIITHGYDPETGLSTNLAATPSPVPIEVPSSESTGETRALIQNKSTQEEDFSSELDEFGNNSAARLIASSTTSTLEKDDLVVVPLMDKVMSSDDLVISEYDLHITPYSPVSSATE